MLRVIREKKAKAKNVAKPAKIPTTAVSPKSKAKRKLVIYTSDSEKTSSPQLIRRAWSHNTKLVATPGIMPVLSSLPVNVTAAVRVVPILVTQSQNEHLSNKKEYASKM